MEMLQFTIPQGVLGNTPFGQDPFPETSDNSHQLHRVGSCRTFLYTNPSARAAKLARTHSYSHKTTSATPKPKDNLGNPFPLRGYPPTPKEQTAHNCLMRRHLLALAPLIDRKEAQQKLRPILRGYLTARNPVYPTLKATFGLLVTQPNKFALLFRMVLECDVEGYEFLYQALASLQFPSQQLKEELLAEATEELIFLRQHFLPRESEELSLISESVLTNHEYWLGIAKLDTKLVSLAEKCRGWELPEARLLRGYDHSETIVPGRNTKIQVLSYQVGKTERTATEYPYLNRALILRGQHTARFMREYLSSKSHELMVTSGLVLGPVMALRFVHPLTNADLAYLLPPNAGIDTLTSIQCPNTLPAETIERLFQTHPTLLTITDGSGKSYEAPNRAQRLQILMPHLQVDEETPSASTSTFHERHTDL